MVQIKNEATNKFKTTNINGNYEFSGLSAGIYQINVGKRGFVKKVQSAELIDGQVLQLDFTLEGKAEG